MNNTQTTSNPVIDPEGKDATTRVAIACPSCRGSSAVFKTYCALCRGAGIIYRPPTLPVAPFDEQTHIMEAMVLVGEIAALVSEGTWDCEVGCMGPVVPMVWTISGAADTTSHNHNFRKDITIEGVIWALEQAAEGLRVSQARRPQQIRGKTSDARDDAELLIDSEEG